MLDTGDAHVRLPRVADYFRPPEMSYVQQLQTMLRDSIDSVSGLTAYHIGEIGLRRHGCAEQQQAQTRANQFVQESFHRNVPALVARSTWPQVSYVGRPIATQRITSIAARRP